MRRGVTRKLAMVAAVAALTAVACGGSSSTTTPTTPTTTVTVTETFSGTLNVNGAASFPFTVSGAGLITATLASLARSDGSTSDPAPATGLGLGTWNGTSCQVVLPNDNGAAQGQQLIGQATGSGSLCLRVYDVGKFAAAVAYTVTVVHP